MTVEFVLLHLIRNIDIIIDNVCSIYPGYTNCTNYVPGNVLAPHGATQVTVPLKFDISVFSYTDCWSENGIHTDEKTSIYYWFCHENNPSRMKCLKFELLDRGTGHCTKSVYCGETNDEHCFVNLWNHGIELMGINSAYVLIHDARVCNFCVDCGMNTRLLCCYEFCAVMMMLCLLSPQNFTSLSLCQYI